MTVSSYKDEARLRELRERLENARRIALTCHRSPDGDALGSTLGLAILLRGMGKDARVITPDEPPHTLRILPESRTVMAWSSFGPMVENWVKDADLILCMDYNAPYRLSRLESAVMASRADRILIDHHKEPEDFTVLTFSEPLMSSTCELTARLIRGMGWWDKVTTDTATCLLGGIITDTGGFHYNSSQPGLYRVVADLMEHNVDKDRLIRALIDTRTESAMRLEAFAVAERMTVFADHHATLITLSRDDLNRYGYRKGDTEGLVNKPLEIPGIVYSAYFRQEDGYVKVSMRSLGDFPVDLLCKRHYGGGGHANAAGGEFEGTMEEAIEVFRRTLAENDGLITPQSLTCADRK